MKRHLYGAATMIVALATLASSGTALAQNATSTSGHDHGNWNGGSNGNWDRGGNNNNWNHGGNNNWNRGGNWGGSNGNNWGQWGHNNWGRWGQQRHHGNFYGFGNRGFWFGGQEYIYTGRAFDVGVNSFTLSVNGARFPVVFARGFVRPGSFVRVFGVFRNGVIFARGVTTIH